MHCFCIFFFCFSLFHYYFVVFCCHMWRIKTFNNHAKLFSVGLVGSDRNYNVHKTANLLLLRFPLSSTYWQRCVCSSRDLKHNRCSDGRWKSWHGYPGRSTGVAISAPDCAECWRPPKGTPGGIGSRAVQPGGNGYCGWMRPLRRGGRHAVFPPISSSSSAAADASGTLNERPTARPSARPPF